MPPLLFFSLSWLFLLSLATTIPMKIWYSKFPINNIKNSILWMLLKEVSFTLKEKAKGQYLFILLIFFMILLMNFTALYPQIFSLTSHLTITLPLSLTTWLAIVSFGWTKNTKHMLVHLVPQGTPSILMSFMVLIELVSNLIRPITLCVRLTANLIAGHLLMTLLGNFLMSMSSLTATIGSLTPLTLTILETAVACIQAYVFMTLATLYITEIK